MSGEAAFKVGFNLRTSDRVRFKGEIWLVVDTFPDRVHLQNSEGLTVSYGYNEIDGCDAFPQKQ